MRDPRPIVISVRIHASLILPSYDLCKMSN